MKQILRFKRTLIALVLVVSSATALAGSVTITNPGVALAAGCIASPATDSQATAQSDCMKKYAKDCKDKGFGNAFCDALTVEQINECANNSGFTLKKACLQTLKDAAVADESEVAEGELASSSDYNPDDCSSSSYDDLSSNNCGVIKYILLITNILSGLAGVVIVAMMIVGGIQYSMAGADPSKVQAAKQKIFNAILALVLFSFGFALIQWLVPGGVF